MAWDPVANLKGPQGEAADESNLVHKTGTETIEGAKTFSTPPAIPVGNLLVHAVRRDDPRMTNERVPTAHNHSASDINSGTLSNIRLPQNLVAYSDGNQTTGTNPWTVDSALATCAFGVEYVLLHNSGLNVPAGTPINHQIIRVVAFASGAQRTFTFASGIRLSTGITSRTITIPAGQVMISAIEYSTLIGAWTLTAATVSVT